MDQTSVTVANQNRIPLAEIERMALAFAKSGLFGIKNPEQGIALMLIAQAEGMHPAIAARDFHIVDGKPTLKADALLARFQQAGGKVSWGEYTDKEVTATFSHPQGGSVTVSWTIAQAESIGLARKSVWKQYPRAMLRARVISEGIRTVYPGVTVGVYTPEEVADFDVKPEVKTVEAQTVVAEQSEPPAASSLHPVVTTKEQALKAISQSGWTKAQLIEYCQHRFGVSTSKELNDAELLDLARAVTLSSFSDYMVNQDDEAL